MKTKVTAEMFREAMGEDPVGDDLERCNCDKEGEPGHKTCGWCDEHNKPKYICPCPYRGRKD